MCVGGVAKIRITQYENLMAAFGGIAKIPTTNPSTKERVAFPKSKTRPDMTACIGWAKSIQKSAVRSTVAQKTEQHA
jgi:hypothetical protein